MKAPGKFAALILAAGYSSRMQALKPLLPLGGSTVLAECIRLFSMAGVNDIRVVVGFKADEIRQAVDSRDVTWVLNPDYEKGMLSSILAGAKSLESNVEAFFLLPADMPLVRPSTILELMECYEKNTPKIVYPRFGGKRGHPPLISRSCLEEGVSPDHPGGLRAYLKKYETEALDVDVADRGVVLDCDTPEDYLKIKEHSVRGNIPAKAECEALAERFGASERVMQHSRLVAELARVVAVHLRQAGLKLNHELIEAAGLLHDIAKGKPDHAGAGAELLRSLGFHAVAEVVASHMDIQVKDGQLTEADLIYLADKYVAEDTIVSLSERFARSLERYSDRPDIAKEVKRRFEKADAIRNCVEKYLRQSLESLIRNYQRSIYAAARQRRREICLVRHGAIGSERRGRHYFGQLDLPLNFEGRKRAAELAETLQDLEIANVYCSDLKRSLKTAEMIAAPHGLKPLALRELREISLGEWEGLSFSTVRKRYPEAFAERGRDIVHFRPPGGESFLECAQRVIGAFNDILQSSSGNIVIVGHAGVNRILLAQALGKSLDQIFEIDQDYGCLNLIRCTGFSFEVTVLNGERVGEPDSNTTVGNDYHRE